VEGDQIAQVYFDSNGIFAFGGGRRWEFLEQQQEE